LTALPDFFFLKIWLAKQIFSADMRTSRIFSGNCRIRLKIWLNVINSDDKPDVENVSITTKKLKVLDELLALSFYEKKTAEWRKMLNADRLKQSV